MNLNGRLEVMSSIFEEQNYLWQASTAEAISSTCFNAVSVTNFYYLFFYLQWSFFVLVGRSCWVTFSAGAPSFEKIEKAVGQGPAMHAKGEYGVITILV